MDELPLEVTCQSVKERLDAIDDFLLLDCREREERAVVAIEASTLLPMSEIQRRAAELEELRERSVVVYCHHGGRSLQVAQWLRQNGYTQAQSMSGGIDQWAIEIDASLPRY